VKKDPLVIASGTKTLREKIVRNRRILAIASGCETLSIAVFASLWLAGVTPSWALVAVAGIGLALVFDLRNLRRTESALKFYDANPAVAYLAEIRNTFGA